MDPLIKTRLPQNFALGSEYHIHPGRMLSISDYHKHACEDDHCAHHNPKHFHATTFRLYGKITLKSSVIQEELLYIAFGMYHKTSVNHGVCLVTFFSNMKEIWRGTYTKIL